MKLTFLGTSAANACPIPFCACGNCQAMRAHVGPSLRKRSALLVNDDLLIDFGPDVLASAQRFNLSLWGVTTALVTHAHSDHFYTGNLGMRGDAFTRKVVVRDPF